MWSLDFTASYRSTRTSKLCLSASAMQSCNDNARVAGALVCATAADTRPAKNKLAPIFFIGNPDAARHGKVTERLSYWRAFGDDGVLFDQLQHFFVEHLIVKFVHAIA